MEVRSALQDVTPDQSSGERVTVAKEPALVKEEKDRVDAIQAIVIQHLAEAKVPPQDRRGEAQGSAEQDIRIEAGKGSQRHGAERARHQLPRNSQETKAILKRQGQRHEARPALQPFFPEVRNKALARPPQKPLAVVLRGFPQEEDRRHRELRVELGQREIPDAPNVGRQARREDQAEIDADPQ